MLHYLSKSSIGSSTIQFMDVMHKDHQQAHVRQVRPSSREIVGGIHPPRKDEARFFFKSLKDDGWKVILFIPIDLSKQLATGRLHMDLLPIYL